ncbi:MAG: hypothetical protein WBO37_10735 [Gammaproteobacteria bacterium]
MSCTNSIVSTLVLTVLLLGGCAGRPAHPVMVYQPQDEGRSCDAIERELELIENDILDLVPQTDKAHKNTRLGVAGIFLLIPFFFMDLSKAEQVEVNALIKRYNHLLEIGEKNHCGLEREAIPDFSKTDY